MAKNKFFKNLSNFYHYLIKISLILLISYSLCQDDIKTEVIINPETNNQNMQNTEETGINKDRLDEEMPVEFKSKNIIHLTNEKYNELASVHTNMVIFVYCPYSKRTQKEYPFFDELAKVIDEQNIQLKVCVIDGNKYYQFTEEQGIGSFPEIMYNIKGNTDFYRGERTVPILLNFLKREFLGPLIKVQTTKEIDEYTKMNPLVMLCTIDPNSSELEREFKNFQKFAHDKNNQKNVFISCYSEECVQKYPYKVAYLRQFDEPVYALDEDLPITIMQLERLNKFYSSPIGADYTQEDSTQILFKPEKFKIFFYFRDSKDPKYKELDRKIYDFCKKWRDTAGSYFLDRNKDEFNLNSANYFGVWEEDEPVLILGQVKQYHSVIYYKFPAKSIEDFNMESMDKWVSDYLARKLTPEVSSEVLPKVMPEGYRIVVRRTWHKEIFESNKNLLVWVTDQFAPGISAIFRPSFDIILNTISKEDREKYNLEILKLDSGRNKIDGMKYYTNEYFFYPKGKKDNPIQFQMAKPENLQPTDYEVVDWLTDLLQMPKVKRLPKKEEPKFVDAEAEHDHVHEGDENKEKKEIPNDL